MKFEVLHFSWAHEDDLYEGGVHEVEKPSKGLLDAVGAAAACPDPPVRVVSASKDERSRIAGAVQSQSDGESANARAQASGEWQKSNVEAQLHVYRSRLAAHEQALKDESLDGRMTDEQLAYTRFALEQTVAIDKAIKKGASFDEAAAAWHRERAVGG